jgi:hypothetical protein
VIRPSVRLPLPSFPGDKLARATRAAILVGALVVSSACSALPTNTSQGGSGVAVSPASPSGKDLGSGEVGQPSSGAAAPTTDTSALPSTDPTRSVIRTGAMDLVVQSVPEGLEAVRQVATAANGNVSDSSFTSGTGVQAAQLTLRVPVDRFAEVIARIEKVAVEVRAVTTSSRDVTDEVTDVEATLSNLRAVEAQYVQLLGRAGTIGDVLQVQDRLNQVRLQIDRTEARQKYLASQTEMATLTVSLRAAATEGTGPFAAAHAAWAASLRTLNTIATVALVVVVYSWWLIPVVALAAWLVVRRIRRRDARTDAQP